MATLTNHGNLQPVCQNCTTSTTPLWRRDELGSVLCNACGLFLKLHGSPRPISLKTDVIKSRNRVKTAGQQGQPQGQKRKVSGHGTFLAHDSLAKFNQSLYDGNGLPASQSEADIQIHHGSQHHRVLHKTSSGASERSNSPLSRTDTPSLHHHPSNIAPQHMFDGVLNDHVFQSPAMPSIQLRNPSPGSISSTNDRHLEPPKPYDELLQDNTHLKTRVSELEVINELYKGTVHQYQQGGNAPQAEMISRSSEDELRQLLQQSQQREESLKHQVEQLEQEITELRSEQPPAKRGRVSSLEYPEPPQTLNNGLHS